MGCKSSKSINVVLPTRTTDTAITIAGLKTELTPDRRSIQKNESSRNTPRPSFSEYMSPINRSQAFDTSEEYDSLNQSNLDKKPKGEKRRISVLDSIYQQIREDDLKAKLARLSKTVPERENQPGKIVYQIKINGKLVAQTSTPKQDNRIAEGRKHRERSMTETTNHSISKKSMTKSTPRNNKRKVSDGSVRSIRSIIGQLKPSSKSMPELYSKNIPTQLLGVPEPEKVKISLHFEKHSLQNLKGGIYSDSEGNTPNNRDSCSFSSISQE